ncbi:hypothetical protein V8C86DRAFT_2646911 [Haematococcus lacustris]
MHCPQHPNQLPAPVAPLGAAAAGSGHFNYDRPPGALLPAPPSAQLPKHAQQHPSSDETAAPYAHMHAYQGRQAQSHDHHSQQQHYCQQHQEHTSRQSTLEPGAGPQPLAHAPEHAHLAGARLSEPAHVPHSHLRQQLQPGSHGNRDEGLLPPGSAQGVGSRGAGRRSRKRMGLPSDAPDLPHTAWEASFAEANLGMVGSQASSLPPAPDVANSLAPHHSHAHPPAGSGCEAPGLEGRHQTTLRSSHSTANSRLTEASDQQPELRGSGLVQGGSAPALTAWHTGPSRADQLQQSAWQQQEQGTAELGSRGAAAYTAWQQQEPELPQLHTLTHSSTDLRTHTTGAANTGLPAGHAGLHATLPASQHHVTSQATTLHTKPPAMPVLRPYSAYPQSQHLPATYSHARHTSAPPLPYPCATTIATSRQLLRSGASNPTSTGHGYLDGGTASSNHTTQQQLLQQAADWAATVGCSLPWGVASHPAQPLHSASHPHTWAGAQQQQQAQHSSVTWGGVATAPMRTRSYPQNFPTIGAGVGRAAREQEVVSQVAQGTWAQMQAVCGPMSDATPMWH